MSSTSTVIMIQNATFGEGVRFVCAVLWVISYTIGVIGIIYRNELINVFEVYALAYWVRTNYCESVVEIVDSRTFRKYLRCFESAFVSDDEMMDWSIQKRLYNWLVVYHRLVMRNYIGEGVFTCWGFFWQNVVFCLQLIAILFQLCYLHSSLRKQKLHLKMRCPMRLV